ncbi:TOG array regulator of axonemal microtubules protein 1 isoform X1 [Carcharodon carcharias]|uniref:TOG array regulator of axonemal microtubules protein 1 isoform X1 n=1 Tax=Carcharodon carcharias TaxID=13397 RepID=UPI001B7DB6DC|nr:TOG array regulator of axonemal microtubules protein 1 isoform X1 [Carcharodon carcharias]
MAGSVAKLMRPAFAKHEQHRFSTGDRSEGIEAGRGGGFSCRSSDTRDAVMSARRNGSPAAAAPANMEEDVILQQLNSQTSLKRTEALKALRANVRQNAGRLVFGNKKALFSTLNEVLLDGRREVKVSCIQLISEIIQGSDSDLDCCRAAVLPKLIWSLRDDNPTVRKEVVQTLHVYLKYSVISKDVFWALIEHGLENHDPVVRKATTIILPILLTKEFNNDSLFDVTLCLAKKLSGDSMDDPFSAFTTMGHIQRHIGEEEFNSYLKRLPPSLRRDYNKLMEIKFEPQAKLNGGNVPELEQSRTFKTSSGFRGRSIDSVEDASQFSRPISKDHSNLEFRIIPQELYARLLDREDYKSRTHAVEELKNVVDDFNFMTVPSTSILGLIGFLCTLLDDSNFKVVHGTLEIINLLVVKLNHGVVNYLKPITSATIKVLGDNKVVTKQEYMKVFIGLMKQVGPQKVLDMLLDNIKHKNSRIREEILNIIIASLLTYPSEDFDLPSLCQVVAPALTDSKRKIRHAALEAFAMLASSLGSNKMFLVKAVDTVELQEDGDGVMAAVQARLARRILPKLTPQGLVEYAIPMPSSAHGRGIQMPLGADTEWLLASGRTQSAHSYHGDHEAHSLGYGSPSPSTDEYTSFRRVLSAGRGKSKLPWEHTSSVTRRCGQQTRFSNTAPAEQVQPCNDLQLSPKLRTSQMMQATENVFFTRKPNVSSTNLENNLASLTNSGFGEPLQPQPLARRIPFGPSRMLNTQSHSVDCDLQFLGNGKQLPQDKAVRSSLAHSSKNHAFYNPIVIDPTPFPTSSCSQGSHYLPSFQLPTGTKPINASVSEGSSKKFQEQSVHFSNSWPTEHFDGVSKPSSRRLTNQLSEDLLIFGDSSQESRSPISLKPALVRLPSSRRDLNTTKPVPPIPRGTSPMVETEVAAYGNRKGTNGAESEVVWEEEKSINKNLELDLSSLDNNDDETDHEEMMSALKSLRNSAAKKRAKLSSSASDVESPDSALKLELGVNSTSRTSSPYTSTCSESDVYSQESLTSPLPYNPCGKKIMSDGCSQLGSKPRHGQIPSGKARPSPVEYSPISGVTFRDKTTSDVSIVGQRMTYGNGIPDSEEEKQIEVSHSSSLSKFQSKEHQKNITSNKSARGLTGSTFSTQQMNNYDTSSGNGFSEDSVVIVGKGVFGSPQSVSLTYSQAITPSFDNGDEICDLKQTMDPPSGIYGRAVPQNSQTGFDASENEREISMSKSARDKMKQRKREGVQQCHSEEQGDHAKKEEKLHERLRNVDPDKTRTETLSISSDVFLKLKTDSSPVEIATLSPSQLKHSTGMRKNRTSNSPSSGGENAPGPRSSHRGQTPSVLPSPEVVDPSELRPFSKPDLALSEALKLLCDEDWEKKIEGINCIRCLSTYHSDVLTVRLHEAVFPVVQEVKNLRSGVSRVAVLCLGDMFTVFKKNMDQELDNTVKILLHKASESNAFIREDVDKALNAMVMNVTPARALSSLINGGLNHLNAVVRKCTAQHLANVVERMGAGRLLSGIKDITDRIIHAVAKFAQDGSQETRYYGRKMLFIMMSHHDFDKVLEKHLPPRDLPYIRDTVNTLRQKGLGEMPLDTPSAKGRRYPGSGGSMRASSSSREVQSLTGRDITEGVVNLRDYTWRPSPRNLMENAEYLKEITGLLGAKDFRDRSRGIEQLLTDCLNNQELVVINIVKIFDAFKPRLHDFNSKVNQMALETMQKMIPLLKDNLAQVLNILFPAIVDNNLNSKNLGIYNAAIGVIHTLVQHIDNFLLLQHFCNKAQFLNGKAKQDMTERLADLVPDLYTRKPQIVEQKVLPVLWHLLGNMTNSGSLPGSGGNIRVAAAKLAKALFKPMGQSLIDQAPIRPPHIAKTLQDLLDLTP